MTAKGGRHAYRAGQRTERQSRKRRKRERRKLERRQREQGADGR